MHRHPNSGEQLYFKRREFRADPIEPPPHKGDTFIAAVTIGGILGAILVFFLERM